MANPVTQNLETDFVYCTKRYILTELGYPNIEVELCDEHLDNAIKDAFSDFRRYNALGAMRFWAIDASVNQTEYDLPEELLVVRDVVVMRLADFDSIFDTDVLVNPLYLKNSYTAYQDILTFWLSEAAFETWKRVYGLDESWDIIGPNQRIRIYPTPRSSRKIIIKGTARLDLKDLTERDFGTKDLLFRELALAYAKRTLGLIRGKYPGGVNSSQGPVQLDGAELRQEANAEIAERRQELQNTGRPLGFYAG